MRTRLQRKLISAAVMLTAVGVTLCGASYLDRMMSPTSPFWIVGVILMGVGSMLGVSWICDEYDAYLDRRAQSQRDAADRSHRNGRVNESWQFDPLDELRAVVYRANLRPALPRRSHWSPTRVWRGQ